MSAPSRAHEDGPELRDLIERVDMRALYERLTGKSANGRRTSKGPKVHCPNPACSDRDPSAVIWERQKAVKLFDTCEFASGKTFGGVLDLIQFTGHANSKKDAVEWLKASGLVGYTYDPVNSPAVVSQRSGRSGNGKRDKLYDLREAGTYDYVDATGTTMQYRVIRWEGYRLPKSAPEDERKKSKEKVFSQYHPDPGSGEFCQYCYNYRHDFDEFKDRRFHEHPKLMAPRHPGQLQKGTLGVTRVPYRLNEVLEAASKQFPIFYVEGEKKVDALRKLGLYATTNMGGAEFPIPAEWSQYFSGAARVIFIPDCDVPGRECSWKRLKVLKQQGVPAMFLDINPSFAGKSGKKYDIYDWYEERLASGREAMLAELREKYREALQIDQLGRVLVIGDSPDGVRYQGCETIKDAIALVKKRDFSAIDIRTSGAARDLKELVDVAASEGVRELTTPDRDAQAYFARRKRELTVRM